MGNLDYSESIFNGIENPNTFMYNAMIKGFSGSQKPEKSIGFFYKMLENGVKTDKFTYPFVFKACTLLSAIEEGKQIHGRTVKSGLNSDVYVQNSLMHFYANGENLGDACKVFDTGSGLNVSSWNTMVSGYLKFDEIESARQLFDEMLERDVVSWNCMMDGYVKIGDMGHACRLFNDMPKRNVVSWSTMISGYVQNSDYKEALNLFRRMQIERVNPNRITLVSVLPAIGHIGALCQGEWVHGYIDKHNMELDCVLGSALADMYSRCGKIRDALCIYERIVHVSNCITWNAMIQGLAMHGQGIDALKAFSRMQSLGIAPDHDTFVGVLSACNHAGLVEEGLKYFSLMKEKYNVMPGIKHYGCLIDLLGRAGRFDEALDVIHNMPMDADAVIWGSLLGSCRNNHNIELGEYAAKKSMELDPKDSGFYVLLSNMYADAGRWGDVERVRKDMNKRRVKKMPGCSSVELNGVVHEFTIKGSSHHPQKEDIANMLDEIEGRLRSVGYVPQTSEVLLNMKEEEKEAALYRHSERVALAFALISTGPGTPIRIVKNLRVCEDCHWVLKLVSSLYEREILVRDQNRFHCFKNGSCSCLDYW
ncbi:pentatricopeptide repeat-containing protein At5g48910-like [Amborella trichopoda]|uniref:pentatricopeptide repeat-containing protein At5g48910-like n=1 Tax=Amborella trichopoda TaxID=13333 RepID=UPI0005D448EC|nr:pentatricopeptide repeat-containing protein At5g48910-like [Amborella trichopoda]|eukprot:XP_011623476.1 pentatricopeptide repeat-containing protein At5g48910-like [Amborella trichopoda]